MFDIDDTLYLERDYVRSGFRAVGEWVADRLGVDRFADRAWARFETGARRTVFDEVFRELGFVPEPGIVEELVGVYRQHEPRIAPLPDAARTIALLMPRVKLAVVTDGPIDSQRAKARALGVERWATATIFTAELGGEYAKPHVRGFEHVEHAVALDGARCVYVADNPAKDFAGPHALGWRTVRVRRAGSEHVGRASGADVDTEVADLDDLAGHLGLIAR